MRSREMEMSCGPVMMPNLSMPERDEVVGGDLAGAEVVENDGRDLLLPRPDRW